MTTVSPPEAPTPPRLPIDPRIRERRIAVRRAEGRRRLRLICVTLSLILAGGLVVGITHSSLLAVHHVEVTGIAHTRSREVLATAGLRPGALMLGVHPDQAARRLAALPWVDSATVHRLWPNSVRIRIRERQAVAVVGADPSGLALLDASGRVLAVQAGGPAPTGGAASAAAATSAGGAATPGTTGGLPTIRGVDPPGPPGTTLAAGAPARDALALVAAADRGLVAATVQRIVAVVVAADGQLSLQLTASVTVRFGPPEDLDAKVLALGTLLGRVDLNGVSMIDVRVPDAPVLTRPSRTGTVSTTPRG